MARSRRGWSRRGGRRLFLRRSVGGAFFLFSGMWGSVVERWEAVVDVDVEGRILEILRNGRIDGL